MREGDRQEARVPLSAPLVHATRRFIEGARGEFERHFRVCGPSGLECPVGGDSLVSERGGSSRG